MLNMKDALFDLLQIMNESDQLNVAFKNTSERIAEGIKNLESVQKDGSEEGFELIASDLTEAMEYYLHIAKKRMLLHKRIKDLKGQLQKQSEEAGVAAPDRLKAG